MIEAMTTIICRSQDVSVGVNFSEGFLRQRVQTDQNLDRNYFLGT